MAKTIKTTTAPKTVKSGKVLQVVTPQENPVASVTVSDAEWIDAGFGIGHSENIVLDLMARLAASTPTKEQIAHAREQVIVGYLISKVAAPGEYAVSPEAIATATALARGTASTASKAKDGTVQRTADQDRDYGAGKQRWSRAARKAGLEQAHGGAGNANAGAQERETDKSGSDTPRIEVSTSKSAASAVPADMGALCLRVHDVAVALKALNSPALELLGAGSDLLALYIKALSAVNELDANIARAPK